MPEQNEVRMEWLMPAELSAALAECPTLFLPLGTIEWHGEHNIVGLDAIKAQALCVRAAATGGGLVHPPLYGGVGGLDEPYTFVMDAELPPDAPRLRPWLEQCCREAHRNGFRAIIILTGHYGPGQQIAVRETAVRMSQCLGIPVLGAAEYFLALDMHYYGDHAAFFETSLMMHLFPEHVDTGRLGHAPHRGVGGRDPKLHATPEDGQRLAGCIIERLARLASDMPSWDAAALQGFIRAESAITAAWWECARNAKDVGDLFAGWNNLFQGVLDDYPAALVERRFDDIEAMAARLVSP